LGRRFYLIAVRLRQINPKDIRLSSEMNPKDSHVYRKMDTNLLFDPYGVALWVVIDVAIYM
jgi:hypothetical protein